MPNSPLPRRRFIHNALAGGAALPFLGSAIGKEAVPIRWDMMPPKVGAFSMPARELPLVEDADVIVCGAGPAGVSAAITAARAGANVRLFEWRGCLGGVWTAGLLGYFLDFDKPGFAKELRESLERRNARANTRGLKAFCYDPEALKLLLEELCVEAGVKFQYHTKVSAAFCDGRRLTTIVTESKSGPQAWRAPVFIDTTGDGDVGALAGCEFEIGEASGCPCQPMSLNALLVVNNPQGLREYIRFGDPQPGENSKGEKKQRIKEAIIKTGHYPSYANPTFYHVRDNLFFAMMNHQYGVKPWDSAEITAATVQARAEMNKMVDGLRNLGGAWEGLHIVATAEQIGVRDGRRLSGRFKVTTDDVVTGARFDDAVVRATFEVDVHATSKMLNQDDSGHRSDMSLKVKPYDIPLRALIAKDVDGLMMAGRCISGDFIAHSSYRVTGNAVGMGEAAGAVAAIAALSKREPHEVSWGEGVDMLAKIRRA